MRTRRLRVRRGDRVFVSDLELSLRAGEITVVLGPNGAGKSTLLLALAGLIPHAGCIHLLEHPLQAYDARARARHIAWMGDLPPVEFGLRARQRLALVARQADLAAMDVEITQVARDLELESLLDRPMERLSSGERQRLEWAALLLRRAPVWLLDEPTAHLDFRHQALCVDMLRRQADHGRSMLIVLHDLRQARALASQIVLLDGQGQSRCGSARQMLTPQILRQLFGVDFIHDAEAWLPSYHPRAH